MKRRRVKRPPEPLSLVRIPPSYVNGVWPLCAPFLERACEGTEWSAEELREQTALGRMQLWFVSSHEVTDAAAVTTIEKQICFIVACGGRNIDRWLWLLDELETWAKSQGCSIMRLIGRKGWIRKLPDYHETRVVLDKRL